MSEYIDDEAACDSDDSKCDSEDSERSFEAFLDDTDYSESPDSSEEELLPPNPHLPVS